MVTDINIDDENSTSVEDRIFGVKEKEKEMNNI